MGDLRVIDSTILGRRVPYVPRRKKTFRSCFRPSGPTGHKEKTIFLSCERYEMRRESRKDVVKNCLGPGGKVPQERQRA